MLKKKALNRIFITTVSIFVIFIIYSLNLKDNDITIYNDTYHITSNDKTTIYALNDENLLVRTTVYIDNSLEVVDKVKEILNIMIEKNNKNALLPSDLKPILPKNTSINDVTYSNGILKIDFSKELLNIKEEQSEKMIEAIIYSLSDFDNLMGIEIYVDKTLLKYVPNTNKKLPTMLTKDFGINKVYNITSNKDINKVLLYFYTKSNNELYYVPVTSYVNDNREKVEIIVESLANYVNNNLISYVNQNVKLLDYKEENNTLKLVFNENILDNKKNLNQDAIDMIIYSVFNNYDVEKVEILVNNDKLLEKLKKDTWKISKNVIYLLSTDEVLMS